MGNKLTPVIRFKGFKEDWEQRKLGELASFSKGAGYTKGDLKTTGGKPIILYGRLYTKYETVIENVDTFVDEKEKSVISAGNEIIVPASGETSEDISRASVVAKPGIILGGDLNIVKPNTEIDASFLALTISNGRQQKELSKKAQGKSVVHLHNSDLKEVNLVFPQKEEQTEIGHFFRQLDATITLQERKLELLKIQKKGYLQKMFPKQNEKVPELRFKGFNDTWEQRKLGLIFDILDGDRGKNYPNEKDFFSSGPTLFLDTGNVRNTGFKFTNCKFISKEKNSTLKSGELELYDFVITSRGTLGNVAYYDNNVADEYPSIRINSAMLILRPKLLNEISNDYILSVLRGNLIEIFMKKNHVGSAQPHITKRDFVKLDVNVPKKYEEQTKIGNFFKQLDETITLQECKLNT